MPTVPNTSQQHRRGRIPGLVDPMASISNSLLSGLTAYYKLGEASGTRADELGNYHLTASGTPGNAVGIIGNGLSLTAASSQYITRSGSIAAIGTSRSFSVWVNPTSTSLTGRRGIISNGAGAIDGGVNFQIEIGAIANGKIGIYQSGIGNAAASSAAVAGTWYHLVALVTGTSSSLYINNSLTVTLGPGIENNNNLNLFVGVGYNGYWDGVIDELGIWTRVLTNNEIAALYNGGAGLTYPFV